MLPVPSFSSFPALPSNSSGEVKNSDNEKKSRKGKRRRRDKDLDLDPVRDDAKRERAEDIVLSWDSTPPLFYSDRRGDPSNLTMGLNRREVPKYRGEKVVLGVTGSMTVYRSGHGMEIGPPGKRKMPSLTDPSSRALLFRNPVRSLLHPTQPPSSRIETQAEEGIILLPSRKPRERSYRDIENTQPNSDAESAADSGASDASDSDDGSFEHTEYQLTTVAINQRLGAEPTSVPNWLLLLSHNLSTVPITSKNASTARAEISISILTRALDAIPQSRILWLKYLQAGEDIWHESKLRYEWENALKKVGGGDLWMEWMECQIRRGRGGISAIVDDVKRALSSLQGDEISQLRVFWRLAVALQQAGFPERATAMFQAQAELTFHVPSSLGRSSFQQSLDSLEEFWETEVPRVGEENAPGWDAWVSAGSPTIPPPSYPTVAQVDDLDPYRKFCFSEQISDGTQFMPCRATDDAADSDPYATILFSDIRDVLLYLVTPTAKDAFRYAWLSLLGLHVPGFVDIDPEGVSDLDGRWSHVPFTRASFYDALFRFTGSRESRITNDAVAGTIIGREREYREGLGGPVMLWGRNTVHPLKVPSADGRSRSLWRKEELSALPTAFIRNVFAQLRDGNCGSDWDWYALAFENALGAKRCCTFSITIATSPLTDVCSALKLSRSFLANSSDSVTHWAAHARLEQLRGRLQDARKVYQTVLLANASPGTDHGALWWDWAEMEWLAGEPQALLRVLLTCTGVEGTNGIALLRAKRSLDDRIQTSDRPGRIAWIMLRTLFELAAGNGAEAALDVFDVQLKLVDDSSLERLQVEGLLMLFRHTVVLRHPLPPALLRTRAEAAVKAYPSNSILLGLYLEAQKGQGVWGKVRGLLGEETEKTVGRRIEDVWIAAWDQGRWENEVERMRIALMSALENGCTKHSCILWRLATELEVKTGNLPRAKALLFRAIGDCPLVKDLYLLAFGPLRSVFTTRELNSFADSMAEREIRTRRGLDSFVVGWKEKDAQENLPEDDIPEGDEIERSANEYRRLLPY
ncbi:unnamed protein product [Mycena citricolor]|uniref:DUF1740-domain-containing protein n=1 Tax=Mycena citricolor TaxID=2018698 RepID=A0AAD2GYU9_9AGAR|nr:unnamed protein product [Mycena citricolor]